MAFSVLVEAHGWDNTNSTGTGPVDTTGCDLLVAVISLSGATLTDSKSNTWTALTPQTYSDKSARIWYCANPTVGSGHYFTTTGYSGIAVIGCSGVNTLSPYDKQTGAAQSGGSPIAAGTIAPAEEMELIIAGLAIGGSGGTTSSTASFTQGSYIEPGANRYGAALFYKIKGTGDTSSESPSLSWSNGDTGGAAAVMAAFRAAGASGSDTTAPTLSSPSGTGGTLTASGSVSTNEANGTLYAVFTASATAPSASQVKAGQDHTGTSALRAVSQAVSATGSQSIASGAVTAGTRYVHFMHEDAATNQSTVASSASFIVNPAIPILSVPTKSTPTATTAIVGATTDTATGTLYAVLTLDDSQPSAAQVKAGQNSVGSGTSTIVPTALPITSSGAKSFAPVTVVSGTTLYGWIVHTEGGGVDSAVLATGALYPGTGRPISDVSAVGWTASSGGVMAAMLDEDSPGSDSDYISSPSLSGTPSEVIMELDKTFPAGTYDIKVRARVNIGTGNLVVRMLNGSNVSQGASATQALTTTFVTYTLPITTSGDSTRISVEVTT